MKIIYKISVISLIILSFASCYQSEDVPAATIVEPSEFTQKLLIEDFTGTWCVYCPGAGHAIEGAVAANDRFIPVGLHYRSLSNPEEMQNEFSEGVVTTYNVDGFPKVYLNRREKLWANDYLVSTLESMLNRYAPVGLAINSTLTGNSLEVNIKVGFVEETTSVDNYKLVVYLVEDGLVYPQHNAALPDLPELIEDYVHNDVLRYSFTNTLGDALPNQVEADHRYTKDFTATLPASIQNTDKLRIVAFVIDKNDNCLNVQATNVGVNQDFD